MLNKIGLRAGICANVVKTFVRGKKKSTMNPSTQKVVNQLSALSASRKQPKLLSLCNEDIIKHRTIVNAWKSYKSKQQRARNAQLQKQYESIQNAMNDLQATSPQLFEYANAKQKKRWPLEMRVPTDFPPTKPWVYNYAPSEQKK